MADSAETDGLDNLINQIGMGRWQVLGLVANFLIWFVLSPHTIGTTLLNAPVPYHCSKDTVHLSDDKSIDALGAYEQIRTNNLSVLSSIYDNKCFEVSGSETPHTNSSIDANRLPSCPVVQYDPAIFESTVTTEFNLICENESKRGLFQDFYAFGLIVGCLFGGSLGDKLGRAQAVLLGAIVHSVATCVVAFTSSLMMLFAARFIVGLTNLMILVTVVTLALETCPEYARGPIGLLVGLPYSLGVVVFACVGIVLRNWRHLYIATSFHAILLVPVAWLLDESPRWLLQVGEYDKAKKVIDRAIKMNRSSINPKIDIEEVLHSVMPDTDDEEKKLSLKEKVEAFYASMKYSMSSRAMCKINIISPIIWFLNEAVYYGIIFNANQFSGDNPFLYVALTGVADGLAILLGIPSAKHLGRRATVAGSQFISGALILLVLVTPEELKWVQWILIMTGFLMCACASQSLFVYTPELFPTSIRARGFAFSNLTGYTGTLVAPLIPEVLAKYAWWATGATLGSIGFISCSLVMCLPETNRLPLCETIHDVEERERNEKKKPWTSPFNDEPKVVISEKANGVANGAKPKAPLASPEDLDIDTSKAQGIDNPGLVEDS